MSDGAKDATVDVVVIGMGPAGESVAGQLADKVLLRQNGYAYHSFAAALLFRRGAGGEANHCKRQKGEDAISHGSVALVI